MKVTIEVLSPRGEVTKADVECNIVAQERAYRRLSFFGANAHDLQCLRDTLAILEAIRDQVPE